MNYYGDTKAIAMRNAIAYARKHQMNLIVLDPSYVYGEREFSSGFYEYLRSIKQGIPVAPGSKRNNFSVIYAGDLAKAYHAALDRALTGIHRFIITNPVPVKMDYLLELFCRNAGYKKPPLLSKSVLYIPVMIIEFVATALQSRKPLVLTRGRINMFVNNVEFCAEKAKQVLSFSATTSLEVGIDKTVRWYKENRYL
jgi:nucleoside-diphosphate-sugar epimerase